jgi:hypothetical protein
MTVHQEFWTVFSRRFAVVTGHSHSIYRRWTQVWYYLDFLQRNCTSKIYHSHSNLVSCTWISIGQCSWGFAGGCPQRSPSLCGWCWTFWKEWICQWTCHGCHMFECLQERNRSEGLLSSFFISYPESSVLAGFLAKSIHLANWVWKNHQWSNLSSQWGC